MEPLYSHPGYPLEKHIQGVLALIDDFNEEKILPSEIRETLHLASKWSGLFHDIGKSTSYFQKYIRNPDEFNLPSELKSHSLLSAVLLFQYFHSDIQFTEDHMYYFTFLIVKRHHGQLRDWLDEFKQVDDELKNLLYMQVNSIDFGLLNKTFCALPNFKPMSKEKLTEAIDLFFEQARKMRRTIMKFNRKNDSLASYIHILFLFSILIDADKSEAGILQKASLPPRKDVSSEIVKTYKAKQNWKASRMNTLRENAFQEVDRHNIDINQHFYSLQLPTGMGKTLTVIQFALNLRKKVEKEKGIRPRIVFSLPFLSITDQTDQVFRGIFIANSVEPDQSLVLSHHHLSELQYASREQEIETIYDYNASKLLIEGWNSEIILTTFVQLFHTIFSNRNKSLRKFHRLANAIIIIDEVQAIPHKYWLVIRKTMKKLSEVLGCYFVFSTATTPAIFEKSEMVQLVLPEKYYQVLSRVELYPRLSEKMTIGEFVGALEMDEERTYLFIFNTIGAAKDFYEKIIEVVSSDEVTFLSTHIPPIERLKRIKEIKKQTYRVVVSTQLVEAGVDIDFDVVYRDLAPLDSIHQAAGRCNRHGMRTGEVHVVELTDGKRSYAHYIYDTIRLNVTKDLLENHECIEEKEFFKYIGEYFQQLTKKMANKESLALLNGMKKLYFDGEASADKIPVSQFQLIEENQERIEVFIELDERAKTLFEQYESIIHMDDRWGQQEAFAKVKADFYQYTVSIPIRVDNKPPIRWGIGYVSMDELHDFYDEALGYKTTNTSLFW